MITVKEEFLTDAKTRRAIKLGGYETLALWLAMKRYAAQNLTDGFVPDESIDVLPGAPPKARKALTALVECGKLERDGSRGFGLVDPVTLGWQLHDYLDHANGSDEVELRREKARQKKALQRDRARRELDSLRAQGERVPGDTRGQSRDTIGDNSETCPRGQFRGTPMGTAPGHSRSGPPVPGTQARPRTYPTQPNPTQPTQEKKYPLPDDDWVPTDAELAPEAPPASVTRRSEPPPAPSSPVEPQPISVSPGARRDPFRAPHHQEDVIRAFGLWREWAQQPAAQLTYGDPRAKLLQDRLDTYGPDSFELVLLGASKDPWVRGDKDGAKHQRLEYLLGSPLPTKYEELLLAGSRLKAREQKARTVLRKSEASRDEPQTDARELAEGVEQMRRALGIAGAS